MLDYKMLFLLFQTDPFSYLSSLPLTFFPSLEIFILTLEITVILQKSLLMPPLTCPYLLKVKMGESPPHALSREAHTSNAMLCSSLFEKK